MNCLQHAQERLILLQAVRAEIKMLDNQGELRACVLPRDDRLSILIENCENLAAVELTLLGTRNHSHELSHYVYRLTNCDLISCHWDVRLASILTQVQRPP